MEESLDLMVRFALILDNRSIKKLNYHLGQGIKEWIGYNLWKTAIKKSDKCLKAVFHKFYLSILEYLDPFVEWTRNYEIISMKY